MLLPLRNGVREQIDIMRKIQKYLFILFIYLPKIALSQEAADWDIQAENLSMNVTLWEQNDFSDYSFIMEKGCLLCGWYFPAKIVVENGGVVAVLNPENNEPMKSRRRGEEGELVFEKRKGLFENIDEIFSEINKAIENNATTTHPGLKTDYIIVEYDENYGFPLSLNVGRSGGISADGSKYFITDSSFSIRISDFSHAL